MGRLPTIPEYDAILTLTEVADKLRCSETKVYKAVRYGHLVPLPRTSRSQRLRFRLTEVTRWINEGASSQKPRTYSTGEMPAHLAAYWQQRGRS
ncbi:hypothetical protein BHE97_18510 [Aeromicrobium sp. PE09-221]|nr:hypothetical protein BHE97_18510 [Aeromicrobium sp. PE09-221]